MKKNNTWENFLKPVVVLVVICIISSAALAVTNQFTAPIIAKQKAAAANAAYLEVLPEADGFEEITDFQSSNVNKALKATNDAGWVIQAYGKGFGGEVPAVVAFDNEGTILKVKFMENAETAGFGQKLADPADADAIKLAESMVGKTGNLETSDVDMISGVTVSSKAAVAAVNAAVNCFNEVALGQSATVEVDTSAMTPEEVRAMLAPGATLTQIDAQKGTTEVWQGDDGSYVIYTEDMGYEHATAPMTVAMLAPGATLTQIDAQKGTTEVWQGDDGSYVIYTEDMGYEHATAPMTVVTGFAADGTITGVWVDASTQTAGIGDVAAGAEYLDQYKSVLGEAGLDGVDTVAGSTQSTRGVKKAVRKAIKAYVALVPDSPAATAEAPAKEETASSEAAASEETASSEAASSASATTMTAEEARTVLVGGAALTEITVPEGLTGAWKAEDGSYVLSAEDMGYEHATAPMTVLVGFDANGAITGVWVDASSQTPGIGDKAAGEEYLHMGYEHATAPMTVLVGFDANGAITGVWVDASSQTPGIGDKAAGEEYLHQYAGISDEAGLDGVDTVAGSTQSTRGVKKAVRKCIKAYAAGLAS